ncbi:MAG: serine/threonine-protein phosphatase [Polyangiaceae bacterium]|nr:serine/threonine-protein phosphatase [Polyangiaceae bacterium]
MRGSNEDAFKIHRDTQFAAVADGVSGNQGGAIAARTALDALCQALADEVRRTGEPAEFDLFRAERMFRAAIEFARNRVQETGSRFGMLQMACTLAAVWFVADHAIIAHVGDSRVYRLRNSILEQLTRDHTVPEDFLRRMGSIPEGMEGQRHVITRAISAGREVVNPEFRIEPLEANDVFILCTDGLTGALADDALLHHDSRVPDRE